AAATGELGQDAVGTRRAAAVAVGRAGGARRDRQDRRQAGPQAQRPRSGQGAAAAEMKRAIVTHRRDFMAILALLALAIVVGAYILGHERLRFPFFSQSVYKLNAEFETAQAVTPGQGQSVRVSGVQIGEISGVTLKNGVAIVNMQIAEKYRNLVHENATALLRPRTGLKDMFVELDPGHAPSPVVPTGY